MKTMLAAAVAALSLAALAGPTLAQTVLEVPANKMIASDAAAKGGECAAVCAKVAWNGQWSTVGAGKSVCGTAFGAVDAGPVWNQGDAQKKCPVVTKATFMGAWTNTPPAGATYAGKGTAVCGCLGGKPFAN